MMKTKHLVICAGSILAGHQAAIAAPVTFQLSSTIDASAIGGAADETLRVTYTVDSNAPVLDSGANFAQYEVAQYRLELGDSCVLLTGGGVSTSVFNDAGTTFVEDSYDISAFEPATTGQTFAGYNLQGSQFVLVDPDRIMFSGTSLPLNTDFSAQADLEQSVLELRNPTTNKRVTLFAENSEFSLTVFNPVASLRALVHQVGCGHGSLANPLEKAIDLLSDKKTSNDAKAFSNIEKFITDVAKERSKGRLTKSQANQYTAAAQAVLDSIPAC
jgi:hypothetical protein